MKPHSLVILVLCLSACASRPASRLTIGAAASFTLALEEIGPAYTQTGGQQPTISIGSTGQLAQQIENGAPFDIFLSADAVHVDRLIEDGLILPETRTVIAYGRLVVIGVRDRNLNLDTMQEIAASSSGRIAIANPEHAPYGQAALQALRTSGLLPLVENRIIYAETVRQAAQLVESGNAEIGIVAASVLTDRVAYLLTVPDDLFDPIEHLAGVLSASPSRSEAEAFLSFMISPTAQTILEDCGFESAISVPE